MIRILQLIISFSTSSIALSGYGKVRLSEGIINSSGILEVFWIGDSWTTVCLDGFNDAAATVACRQLGYTGGMHYSTYTPNTPTFKICQINCTGHEKQIQNCEIVWQSNKCSNCRTNHVVGIKCFFDSVTSPTTHRPKTDSDHSNCTNSSNYDSGSTSMPGIIAGTVGGVVAILTAVAFIIGYLAYNRYAQAVYRSNGREFHNATSVPKPSPHQLPVSKEKMPIQSTNSVPKNTLLDPPPNYSSLM